MKASDYLAEFLKNKSEYVFGVQGGAVVHLFDSFHAHGPKAIYCHHEQAAGFAAIAYARVNGYGACIVTTGPGTANALTPLLGAWQDSIPCLFISGQTRWQHTSYGRGVRQVGSQEAPVRDFCKPIAKETFQVYRPEVFVEILEDAYRASLSGRPGPVLIEIPVDVTWTELPNC